jgi:hypothetical protein
LLAARAGAGQVLLYSLSTGDPTPSPRIAKTEIFAVDVQTGKQRVVFSDAGLDWLILPAYPGGGERQTMVAAGGRIFSRGLPRNAYRGGWPTFPAALYELKIDGSNQGRKVFDIEGNLETGSNFRNLFADPAGARIGYLTYENGKPYLYLRETNRGALLRRMDLSRTTLDCLITNIGFLPDAQRIFFTLDTGDDDATSKASYGRVGTYGMKTDGTPPVRTERIANLVAPLSGGRNLYAALLLLPSFIWSILQPSCVVTMRRRRRVCSTSSICQRMPAWSPSSRNSAPTSLLRRSL